MQTTQGYALTPAQITDTVNHQDGVSRISCRYQLLDRNLGSIADITTAATAATITNDTTNAVQRSLDVSLDAIQLAGGGVNLAAVQHLIEPFVRFHDANLNVLFEVPWGIFRLIIPDQDIAPHGITYRIKCLDLSSLLADISPLNSITFSSGTYLAAVQTLLTMDYLPKSLGGGGATPAGLDCGGPNWPLSRLNIDTSGDKPITYPISFTRKDNFALMVNALLDAINYRPFRVTATGIGLIRPKPYLNPDNGGTIPQSEWSYATDMTSILKPPQTWTVGNQADLANAAIVEANPNSASSTPLVSIKYNQNPQSAISFPSTQRIKTIYTQNDLLPDQASCDLAAWLLLQQHAMLGEQLQWEQVLNPFTSSYDFLTMNVTTKDGSVIVTPQGTPFEGISWTADLFSRTMTQVAGRQVIV